LEFLQNKVQALTGWDDAFFGQIPQLYQCLGHGCFPLLDALDKKLEKHSQCRMTAAYPFAHLFTTAEEI